MIGLPAVNTKFVTEKGMAMSFKFESPVKLPRFTTEQFKIQKAKYVAEHGYTIHIPGFTDIFKWETAPDPTPEELELYRKGDAATLGEKRFDEIKQLKAKKREMFLRMLASPTPDIVQNAGSILTALDDINDALGTFAVIARIVARRLPRQAAKFLTGPAGWALLLADIAGLALELSSLPYKSKRIQHALSDTVKGHPLSKKAKLRRLNKLKRLRLTKGEIIEGLQTTENMFGIGISLGPIVGLIYDIPAGIYRHLRGEKVTVSGIPAPFNYLEGIAANVLRNGSQLFTGLPKELDTELPKAMAAIELSSRVMRTTLDGQSPLDVVDQFDGVVIRAARPRHPLTQLVVQDELGYPDMNTGWVHNSRKETEVVDIFNEDKDKIMENVTNWRERNTRDTEAMVGAQNQVEAGLNIVAALEGDDALDLEYDPFTASMLKLMNQGYRLPEDVTTDQLTCYIKQLQAYHAAYGEVPFDDALTISSDICNFDMTTKVPERPTPTPEELEEQRKHNIDGLRTWYYQTIMDAVVLTGYKLRTTSPEILQGRLDKYDDKLAWLTRYGWPQGEPSELTLRSLRESIARIKQRIGI